MNRFLMLIVLFVLIFPAWGNPKQDFDRVVDFYTSLRDLDLTGDDSGRFSPEKSKFLLIEGTLGMVSPSRSYAFWIQEEEIINPDAFIRAFKGSDLSGKTLYSFLSSRGQDILVNGSSQEEIITRLLRDFNNTSRKTPLYSAELFHDVTLSPFLISLSRKDLKTDELSFFNRLLLEALLPGVIKPVTLNVNLIKGEWLGFEDVRQYKVVVRISGEDCFRIFVRTGNTRVEDLYITLNAKVLTAALPDQIITTPEGEKVWLLESFYIKEIK